MGCPKALVWLLAMAFAGSAADAAAPPKPRVAVMSELAPLTERRVVDQSVAALNRLGCAVSIVAPERLAEKGFLAPDRFDLLVLPQAATFPAAAQQTLMAYLQAKGRVLFIGAPPFTRYVFNTPDGWRTRAQMLNDAAVTRPFFDFRTEEVDRWSRVSSEPSGRVTTATEASPGGLALHIGFPDFKQWASVTAPAFVEPPYPDGNDLLVFDARGDANTDAIVVEWREQDGSRWIGSAPLATEWRHYAMSAADFRYWPDSSAPNRGGTGDAFHPQNAKTLILGLAQSHAPMTAGAKNLWVARMGTAKGPAGLPTVEPPVLEAASPWYKRTAEAGDWGPIIRFTGAASTLPPGRLRTLSRGAWSYHAYSGPLAGAAWGVSTQPDVPGELVDDLLRPWHAEYAGPAHVYGAAGAQTALSAHLRNRGAAPVTVLVEMESQRLAAARAEKPTLTRASKTVAIPAGGEATVTFPNDGAREGDYAWRLSFRPAGAKSSVDTINGRVMIAAAGKADASSSVRVRGGEFVLAGRPWRPIGINYWPLFVSGMDEPEYWKGWLSANQYDPVLVEQDLALAQRLKINMVSIQYLHAEHAPQLRDFLARCRAHGIRANVFIGGGHPMNPKAGEITDLLRAADLPNDPAVFAYDIAWEPKLGDHGERKGLDRAWAQWVTDNYGSLEAAEKDWSFAAPRENGALTNPLDNQITADGPWRAMVAAYRRFVDDRISAGYRESVRIIRSLDPVHLVGARSGYGGNGSAFAGRVMAYDLLSGAAHLDFISPEGYSLTGDWRAYRNGGGFTTAYARWASGGKPVFWAEYGRSVYPGTNAQKLDIQRECYDNTLRMVQEEGANGAAGWWWPGGFRVDENSDFGVISPDGTPRPSVLRQAEYAAALAATPTRQPDPAKAQPLAIDRDADARGFQALWENAAARYGALRDQGNEVVLKTDGSGATTTTMPLVAVGNVPATGTNPLKYANAEFASVVAEAAGSGVRLVVEAVNTGEAAWTPNGAGAVVLRIEVPGGPTQQVPLPRAIPRYGRVTLRSRPLPAALSNAVVRMVVTGREVNGVATALPFGERAVTSAKAIK